ncbi:hypothetical protein ACFVY1_42755 [Streptomyces sp. NPDC058293]|uniref:hypothetical protein n=1 Tax=Streptomyces sp. NPDC058293 TaxID=3346429 RepID=UPI0036E8EC44
MARKAHRRGVGGSGAERATGSTHDVGRVYACTVEIPLGELFLLRQGLVLQPSLVVRADQVHQGTDRFRAVTEEFGHGDLLWVKKTGPEGIG